MADVLSLRALNRATLARQLLLGREPVAVPEAVERLGGLQAQEARPPFAALRARLEGFDPGQLRTSLEAHDVVRGTLMRATLQIVSARDFKAFRWALQPVLRQAMKALGDRADGLDSAAVLPVARELLAAGPRTFSELRALLLGHFPHVDERALGFCVRMQLPLVMVPTDDPWAFPSAARFTLAESWLGGELADAGPSEPLVLRHLAAYGPATASDVQSWSGLNGIAKVVAGLRSELVVLRDERGRELFDVPGAPRPGEYADAPVRLLPEFDSLLLAYADRARLVADEHRGKLVTRNLRVRAVFLVDGFVQGTWSISRTRRAATLELAPFGTLSRMVQKELVSEAEQMLRFLEPEWGSYAVTIG